LAVHVRWLGKPRQMAALFEQFAGTLQGAAIYSEKP
jgi:hypothetical protein